MSSLQELFQRCVWRGGVGGREMRGGRENKDIRDNTDRTSEFDSENYVKPIRKQGDNDMAAVVF